MNDDCHIKRRDQKCINKISHVFWKLPEGSMYENINLPSCLLNKKFQAYEVKFHNKHNKDEKQLVTNPLSMCMWDKQNLLSWCTNPQNCKFWLYKMFVLNFAQMHFVYCLVFVIRRKDKKSLKYECLQQF